MGIRARTKPLHAKYAFMLRDPSHALLAKFQKATGLGITVQQGDYREGGAIAKMKESTTADFKNVKLERGVDMNQDLYTWVKECVNMMAHLPEGAGVASPLQLRNLDLDQLKRNRDLLLTAHMFNCQPADYEDFQGDGTSSDIQLESLEISMEYYNKVWA